MPIRTVSRSAKASGISRIGQRREMVIPKTVFDELELARGDFVEITSDGAGRFSVSRKILVDADDTLTPSEAKKVRHGLKQAHEGKTQSWDKVKRELGL
jgi:bifunctional DNA-binding transcriptional regulator/antitoxin component of YhaV-PrlF toxin-antitoxin module